MISPAIGRGSGSSCCEAIVQLFAGSRRRRNGVVQLSSRRLAEEVGLSPSAVRRNLHRLQQSGLIHLTARYSEEGIRLTNQITFL